MISCLDKGLFYFVSLLHPSYINRLLWSSGSIFDCRSTRAWFESYTGLTLNFSGHKNWISEDTLGHDVNWYPERAVSAHVWYSWVLYVGSKQNLEWNSFPRETWMLVFPNVAQWLGEVKGWLNGWIVKSSPTKTGNFNFIFLGYFTETQFSLHGWLA